LIWDFSFCFSILPCRHLAGGVDGKWVKRKPAGWRRVGASKRKAYSQDTGTVGLGWGKVQYLPANDQTFARRDGSVTTGWPLRTNGGFA
jgi:hypothetical protein